jgi:hypothetical protein
MNTAQPEPSDSDRLPQWLLLLVGGLGGLLLVGGVVGWILRGPAIILDLAGFFCL